MVKLIFLLITHADFLFLKSLLKEKYFNTTFKMETLLTNTLLDRKSKLFGTHSIVIGTKELLQRKIYVKKHHFFYKLVF